VKTQNINTYRGPRDQSAAALEDEQMIRNCYIPAIVAAMTVVPLALADGFQARDNGLRGGPPNAGGPLPGMGAPETEIFNQSIINFTELESTCEGCNDMPEGFFTGEDLFLQVLTNSAGLGTRFNADSCFVCHSQPTIGGSGGFLVPNPQDPPNRHRQPENPSFDLIPHRKGATNRVPSFIKRYGPILEARFIRKPDGTPDGGVHQLYTIIGRTDDPSIPGCNADVLPSIDFEREVRKSNIAFRQPLQLFGMGLIDAIQDREILAKHEASKALRVSLGIGGVPNRSPNDGTISRFGWKAQNKSIQLFAAEAYNVEMGVTNDLFPQATDETPECNGPRKPLPNDLVRVAPGEFKDILMLPDWVLFQTFMRFLAPPTPVALSASAQRGQQLFGASPQNPGIGCVACHTATMKTAEVIRFQNALGNKDVNLFSDLLVHHMGSGLADRITQGVATGDMFRTTPLWGIGQRRFFMHDGRNSDLLRAINSHFSEATAEFPASEANQVVRRFRNLSETDKQAMLNFLRSL
jgi:hypothetical protein